MFTDVDLEEKHYHQKAAVGTTKAGKHSTAEDFRRMSSRTFDDLSVLGGVDMEEDYDTLASRMCAGQAAGSADALGSESAFRSDVMRVPSLSLVLPEKPRAKSEKGEEEDCGASSAGSDGGPEDPPSSGKKQPFFDRDRQVPSARQAATEGLATLKSSISKLKTAVTQSLDSFDMSEKEAFAKEREILSARAQGLDAVLSGQDALDKFLGQFTYTMGTGTQSLAPPFRNYMSLKPWSDVEALLGRYDACQDRDTLNTIGRDLASSKRPISALIGSVQSTLNEIQKARETRNKKITNEQKRAQDGAADGASSKKKKKPDTDVFQLVADVPAVPHAATADDLKSWDKGRPYVITKAVIEGVKLDCLGG